VQPLGHLNQIKLKENIVELSSALTAVTTMRMCSHNGVDKDAIEASLAANIEAQKNPTQASGVPW
jgi:hypothetical protein